MTKILIADNLEPEVVEDIRNLGQVDYKPKNIHNSIKDAEVLIVRSATKVTEELLDNAKKLRIVARAGVGIDNIDKKACDKRQIKIINTPGASSNAVAELTIAVILSTLRNVQKAHMQMKNRIWDKKNLVGEEVAGKTLGIIGYGRIGSLVAQKAYCLGMEILAYDPAPHKDSIAKFVLFDELLEKSDIISLHAVLTDKTKNMINKTAINKMRDGVYLVNLARGELVDENALSDACKSGKIRAAALDVYSNEPYTGMLLAFENIYFTPHIAASTKQAQIRIGNELVEKLKQEL